MKEKTKESRFKFNSLVAIIVKSGKLAKILQVIKAFKSVSILLTALSMAGSIFAYSFTFGWMFSVGFVAMIFIHEMGHVIACRQKGIQAKAPVFIPFLGAAIFIPPIKKRVDEAYVGIGGPVMGTMGAILCFLLYLFLPQKHQILLFISYTAALINLFNMIPISPLDGGRITQVVGPYFKYLGCILLLMLTLSVKDPALLLIWILVIGDLPWRDIRHRFFVGLFLEILMIGLYAFGFGSDFKVVLIMDVIMASVFNIIYYARAFNKELNIEEPDQKHREPAPWGTRFKWLAYYLIVNLVLVAVMYCQSSLMPPAAKGHH